MGRAAKARVQRKAGERIAPPVQFHQLDGLVDAEIDQVGGEIHVQLFRKQRRQPPGRDAAVFRHLPGGDLFGVVLLDVLGRHDEMAVAQRTARGDALAHLAAEQQDQLKQIEIAHPPVVGLLLLQLLLEIQNAVVELVGGPPLQKTVAVHGHVQQEIQFPVLQRIGHQPAKDLGVEVKLQDAAPLGPCVGAVGDVGIDHQILVLLQGEGRLEQGEGDAAPGAEDELHRVVQMGGKVVAGGQGAHHRIVDDVQRVPPQKHRLQISVLRHGPASSRVWFHLEYTTHRRDCTSAEKNKRARPGFRF